MRGKHGPMSGISEAGSAEAFTGRTAWARDMAAALRAYLQTEVGSAVVLLAAAVVGLIWANLPGGSYETVWTTRLAVRLGGWGITEELRRWVNDGLMTFFFFVIGLEVRRELDMGELRERRRVAVPVLAALGGMVAPALIYLAINAGGPGARAWGVPMPTDTALALGVLALVGPRFPQRLRVFVLTLVVVDDIASLVVIGVAYTRDLSLVALAIAILFFGVVYLLRFLRFWRGPAYFVVGVALWAAMLESGVHPAVAGVAMGLLATAYPPRRQRLERAVSLTRMFREQPTPEFARSARLSVDAAISTNERLQYLLHPWTSYVIVPLFALANVGVVLRGDLLRSAIGSPITMGVVAGLVVGKLIGISGVSWLATRPRLGGLPLTVPFPQLVGASTVAGIGFTVSLFIADLSLDGPRLEEAKIGILRASIVASLLGWGTFRAIARLPSTPSATTSAGRRRRRSPWSSTATTSARTAAGPSRPSASCSRSSARSCATSIGTCRWSTCTPTPNWRPRPPRPPAPRGASGRCTTCCSPTRTRSSPPTCAATRRDWDWMSTGSGTRPAPGPMRAASPRTFAAPTRAASPVRRPSSSTAAATRAPTTPRRSPPLCGSPGTARRSMRPPRAPGSPGDRARSSPPGGSGGGGHRGQRLGELGAQPGDLQVQNHAVASAIAVGPSGESGAPCQARRQPTTASRVSAAASTRELGGMLRCCSSRLAKPVSTATTSAASARTLSAQRSHPSVR